MRPFELFRSLASELKRRRVMHVVAIYGGVSFAILEAVDLMGQNLRLSPAISVALTILVVFGLPVAVVVGWMFDLDEQGRPVRTRQVRHGSSEAEKTGRRFSWPVRVGLTAIGIVLVSASWYTAGRILNDAVTDPRGSYLVLPIAAPAQTLADQGASHRAARLLTRQLRGWETLRVVQSFALAGLLSRLGIDDAELPTLEQAFQMAQSQNVGTLIGLIVETRGEEAGLEAVMYDVARRREFGHPILLTGPVGDMEGLVAPVAQGVLQLRNQSVSLEDLRSESPNPIAHRDFEDGLDALHDWRLEAAEGHFRSAIAEDSSFASAHHYLALTLYWQTSRDKTRILAAGPEIARLAVTANRLAGARQVRPGLRPHMAAFASFWSGNYDAARRTYREILRKDPSDTEAWLLLGTVEYNDPVLQEVAADSLIPRRNLNMARLAFETAADLSPDWQIAYGHLFEIDRTLSGSALSLRCPAFERPGTPPRPLFEPAEAGNQVAFCPVAEDSIVWARPADMSDERRRKAMVNVERLANVSRRKLETWASIHPDQARPHDELANWLSWRRSTLSCMADPAELRDLTDAILAERELSLSLRDDTTREDLIRIAVLRLAADDADAGMLLLDGALDGLPAGAAVPDEAANIFLAFGMPEEALEVTRPLWSKMSFGIRNPDGDGVLMMGDIKRPITVLRLVGASSTEPDPRIDAAFEELIAEWSRQNFSRRQAAHIRMSALTQGLGPAMALSTWARARWFEGWAEEGLEIPLLWRGFLAADAAGRGAEAADLDSLLDQVLAEVEGEPITTMDQHYLAGLLARRAGRHREAIAQLVRLESCPASLLVQASNWGLRTLGRWHLSQSYFALGDSIRGREALARFSALRGAGDPGAE